MLCQCSHSNLKLFHQLPLSMPPRSLEAIFLIIVVVAVVLVTVTTSYSSIHKLLKSHGLPAGLFPDSVKSYNLDQMSLQKVHLDRPWMAKYETRVLFETMVTTNRTFGQLKGLEGLSQAELFLWLLVKASIVDDPSFGLILIDIGLAHKQLSLSLFEDHPLCRSQGSTCVPCSRIEKNKNRSSLVVSAVGDVSADGTIYLFGGAIAVALIGTSFPIFFSRKDTCPECDEAGFIRKAEATLRANAARKDQAQIVCARCNGLGKLNQIDK